ncbi:class I SAM-dependent methyltransferase [Granulicella sp. dw_53]|uniref:class I SAM-dependent methyltransferase n=1 Tax=Granulicella sp. dw_53 TaxID=2719792 RepID=UPI001BD6B522|nr:class I SAM-dependent methyltransferase [Granulicella sp. dw_53]
MSAGATLPLLATFRDPAGSLEIRPDGVYRSVRAPHDAEVQAFLDLPLARDLVRSGRLIASEIISRDAASQMLLMSHPLIFFSSYPWEWPPVSWRAAAELTLALCRDLLKEGWILKDATPLNVLFRGADPIFVDVLSIQRVNWDQPVWHAYGQFIRTFLLPMLANTKLGWPLQATLIRRDGYEPENIFSALPWYTRIQQPALSSVTLPVLFAKFTSSVKVGEKANFLKEPDVVKEILLKSLCRLEAQIRRISFTSNSSHWSDYTDTSSHYNDEDHSNKRSFVARALSRSNSLRVLDVGCNTGTYSLLAAELNAEVVAIDSDPQTVDRLSRKGAKNVLPLCIDLAFPTPAIGWENREYPSFLSRCDGKFDTVMMLAVLHHLLLSSQIPLDHIARLCNRLTTDCLIVEWVPPTDAKYVEIMRGRETIYNHITESAFRKAFAAYFGVTDELTLANGRILFHLKRRPA